LLFDIELCQLTFILTQTSPHAQAAQPALRAKAAEFLAMLEQSKVDSSPQILKVYAKLVYK
jgi:hypothetical protein